MDVKRWFPDTYYVGGVDGYKQAHLHMEECGDGAYVLHSDYEAKAAECERLRAECCEVDIERAAWQRRALSAEARVKELEAQLKTMLSVPT